MILAAFPIVLSGCVLMTHAKLESQDEAVWRPALEELANAKAPVLADPKERTPDYGIRQVCKVAEGASYRVGFGGQTPVHKCQCISDGIYGILLPWRGKRES